MFDLGGGTVLIVFFIASFLGILFKTLTDFLEIVSNNKREVDGILAKRDIEIAKLQVKLKEAETDDDDEMIILINKFNELSNHDYLDVSISSQGHINVWFKTSLSDFGGNSLIHRFVDQYIVDCDDLEAVSNVETDVYRADEPKVGLSQALIRKIHGIREDVYHNYKSGNMGVISDFKWLDHFPNCNKIWLVNHEIRDDMNVLIFTESHEVHDEIITNLDGVVIFKKEVSHLEANS